MQQGGMNNDVSIHGPHRQVDFAWNIESSMSGKKCLCLRCLVYFSQPCLALCPGHCSIPRPATRTWLVDQWVLHLPFAKALGIAYQMLENIHIFLHRPTYLLILKSPCQCWCIKRVSRISSCSCIKSFFEMFSISECKEIYRNVKSWGQLLISWPRIFGSNPRPNSLASRLGFLQFDRSKADQT